MRRFISKAETYCVFFGIPFLIISCGDTQKSAPNISDEGPVRDIAATRETKAAHRISTWKLYECPTTADVRVKGIGDDNKVLVDLELSYFVSPKGYPDGDVHTHMPREASYGLEGKEVLRTGTADIDAFLDAAERDMSAENIPPEPANTPGSKRMHNFKCMQTLAANVYNPTKRRNKVCGFTWIGGDEELAYFVANDKQHGRYSIVLVWRGSKTLKDFLRDAEAQMWLGYKNVLLSKKHNEGRIAGANIARGFYTRVQRKLPKAWRKVYLNTAVKAARAFAKEHGKKPILSVNVAGHSLGGVASVLSGFMIRQYLDTVENGFKQDEFVRIYAFNPPKVGNKKFAIRYRQRINKTFRLYLFTREGDIVHNVPKGGPGFGYYHPLKPRSRLKRFTAKDCTGFRFHVDRASYLNPLTNHKMKRWGHDFRGLPKGVFKCE